MKPIVNLLLVAGFGLLSAVAASAQTTRGNIKAVRVEGDVKMSLASGGPTIKVVEGAVFRDKTIITTGEGSKTSLVFSNGSAAIVRPNTQLMVNEFKQAPYRGSGKGPDEPSQSKVNMELKKGGIVTSVKKLRSGSEYTVRNPLGAAGVRGTKTLYTYDPNSKQSTTTTISGSNVWQGAFPGTEETPVEEEEQLIAEGEFDANGNLIQYQQRLIRIQGTQLVQLQEEANLLDEVIEEEQPSGPAEEEEEGDGGSNNPINFTSPP
jgi:hypothetical protein